MTAWCLGLVGSLWALTAVDLPHSSADPVVAAFAVLHVVALVIAWYLVAATVAGVLARAARLPALVRGVDLFTIAPVRRLLHASIGAGMAVTSVAGAVTPAGAEPHPRRPPPVLRRLDGAPPPSPLPAPVPPLPPSAPPPPATEAPGSPPPPSTAPPPSADRPTRPPPVLRRLPPAAPSAGSGPALPAPATPPTLRHQPDPSVLPTPSAPRAPERDALAPAAPAPAPPRPSPLPASGRAVDPAPPPTTAAPDAAAWTVAPGDSFWSIAESVVAARLGRPAGDAEVSPYWTRLIEANRARLADPANPDLLFTGQTLALPDP